MTRRTLILLVLYGAMIFHSAHASDDFGKNNPDVKKYEFARSYITALSYMKDIYERWNKDAPKKLFTQKKYIMIKATLNDLALDNSDLRIIKSYLLKYLTSPNMLMRKVADMVVVSTDRNIAINNGEKVLWGRWYDLMAAGQATRPKEINFVKAQHNLELRRKEADKDIVRASVLMTKVLLSDKNKNGKGHLLAITAHQRQALLDKLDSFASDTLDWGLKPGQRTLEGSIAVIREILEDSIWISIDQK